MKNRYTEEKSACGVGFVASRKSQFTNEIVQKALFALRCEEHRGACGADLVTADGSGLMTDIPFKMLGHKRREIAVAFLFAPTQPEVRRAVLDVFEYTFDFLGLKLLAYREVPTDDSVLGKDAFARKPYLLQAIIQRPEHCQTDGAFDKLLYTGKQITRTKLRQRALPDLFFASLSATTIVYKGLTRSFDLDRFYLDLQNPEYKSRFAMFHRRFSTNTTTTWDRAQPFRLIGHNGEFNTITGNRSWAVSREKSMGLYKGELLTESGVSDSGSFNEMVEALLHRSSIPYIDEILAILMPPANHDNDFYNFWGRAMEPWDGPALITYSDGENIGARLDRNGFRPCRWAMTEDFFYLSSEAGSFDLDESHIISKGALKAGSGVRLSLKSGNVYFVDPSRSRYNFDAKFDNRTLKLNFIQTQNQDSQHLDKKYLFSYTEEDISKILIPMIETGKEAIGSMGDTARLAVLSSEPRSFFDYFCHNFAQVTNPPLDYLREKMITDLRTYLGRRPNIFAKKELIPPQLAYELPSPVLSLGQIEFIEKLIGDQNSQDRIIVRKFDITFKREFGTVGFKARLQELEQQVKDAVNRGTSIVILTDENADFDHPAIPCLLALRIVVTSLRDSGTRLKFSMVVKSAEIRTTHQLATTIGMGAAAICPYLALEIARYHPDKNLDKLNADQKEQNLIKAYEGGLLKIMSKMGISVVRSYQSSQLFTSIGISGELIAHYFDGVCAKLSGIGIDEIVQDVLLKTEQAVQTLEKEKLVNTYQYKEHARGTEGEKHSMTAARSKIIHKLVREKGFALDDLALFEEYLALGHEDEPVTVRHLFQLKKAEKHIALEAVENREKILRRFGSGAMSFGAISAEAQRDIFYAMKEIGGRSNSGEGGENPYYYTEGITAYSKQVASARFGVNALYLISGQEIQIKVAQGAKPGEGGQLMGVKVGEDIAKARNSLTHVDLISPPPLHDIYSIEDLRQLIYELKQLHPGVKVNVKLVAGAGIGTIAAGVAKAGADIIHISGGEGGTGAATLSSMKHAGLPWELGLIEVHQTLLENNLRNMVTLRTDGGLHSGKEIVTAALLGAEEYDFGKLLLIAQGCIMARICEKNTCPTGIATHDPRFKAKYKGTKDHIVAIMHYLAEDVRKQLQYLGFSSLDEIIGRTDLLEANAKHQDIIRTKKLNLGFVLDQSYPYNPQENIDNPFSEITNTLNQTIIGDSQQALNANKDISLKYAIHATDRAIPATLCGAIAKKEDQKFSQKFRQGENPTAEAYSGKIQLEFTGSAGQSFCAYLTDTMEVRLYGEANDSVCKTMSGGKVVIRPNLQATFKAHENVIIGNVALYGATGGTLYVNGMAADRFAVRNSGALAVVEGVGLHACEYMTKGKVVILGETSYNIGGGMTGGEVIVLGNQDSNINKEYLALHKLEMEEYQDLKALLEDYYQETESRNAQQILDNWEKTLHYFSRYAPVGLLKNLQEKPVLKA
ncbi:MAG: glutamate synthase large subunit [Microscillaceae bacterium]|nr:glutamate synthase large subunit [Microscillaceae bacterium]